MRRNEGGGSGSSGVRVRAVFAPGGACYIGIAFFFCAVAFGLAFRIRYLFCVKKRSH